VKQIVGTVTAKKSPGNARQESTIVNYSQLQYPLFTKISNSKIKQLKNQALLPVMICSSYKVATSDALFESFPNDSPVNSKSEPLRSMKKGRFHFSCPIAIWSRSSKQTKKIKVRTNRTTMGIFKKIWFRSVRSEVQELVRSEVQKLGSNIRSEVREVVRSEVQALGSIIRSEF